MRLFKRRRKFSSDKGQGLIEAAVILPFLFFLLFNAINFAYFFYVAINLASAPRDAAQYAVQGPSTPAQLKWAAAGPSTTVTSVSYLAYQNLNGLPASTTSPVQVCSASNGYTNPGTVNQTSVCTQYGGSYTFPSAVPDPEPLRFTLFRVDVVYTVQPLIPAQPFGIRLLPSYTLHRQVSMRNM
jgi:Flp pilus assembly protein TadG